MKKINNIQAQNLIKALNTSTPFSQVKGILQKKMPGAIVFASGLSDTKKPKHISPKK